MIKEKAWYQEAEKFLRTFPPFEVYPKTTALLFVDFQNLTCNPERGILTTLGKTYPKEAEYMLSQVTGVTIPAAQNLLKFFRKNKMPVFYAEFGAAMEDGSDLIPLRKAADEATRKKTGTGFVFSRFTYEYQTVDALKPEPNELVINKKTRNAFTATSLDHTMRMIGIESVAIAGACSNICVLATAMGASDLGYKTILLNDASVTFSQVEHDAGMRLFHSYFGSVMDSDDLITALSKHL